MSENKNISDGSNEPDPLQFTDSPCEIESKNQADSRAENLIILAMDDYPLGATLFRTESADAPLVIIAPALAVKAQFYAKFAQFFPQHGFHSLIFDYRGVGRSRPENLRKFKAYMHQWGELDLAGIIRWAAEEGEFKQIFLVGHSAAGQVFPLAENNHLVSAAYFIGSVSAYWKHWEGKWRGLVWLLWHFIIPVSTTLAGYFPGRMLGNGENLPANIAREWGRMARHPDYILSLTPDVPEKFRRVQIPLKFVTFSDDHIAPLKPAKVLAGWYGSADKEFVHIAPPDIGVKAIGHFGPFKERFAGTLWQDALDWIRLQKH